jgi:diguanylate cyclase (GGDEF)-like protein
MSAFAFVNYLLYKYIIPKKKKYAVSTGNIFIVFWGKALLSIRLVGNGSVSWTLLLCAFVMSSMLSIVPTHYQVIIAIIVVSDMTEYIIVHPNLIPAIYNLVDDCIIVTVCVSVNLIFSKRRFLEFERKEMLLGESTRDSLTKLYNRRHLERYYAQKMKKTEICALVMVDLDNFKSVNDSYGHKKGDEVLCEMADILRKNFRETDCVTRLGGDEFAVFLPKLPEKQLVIQRVQAVLKQFPIVIEGEKRTEVSVSAGIAFKDADEEVTYEELCDKADVAMYSAKRAGKAQAVLVTEHFGEEIIITADEQKEYQSGFRLAQ